MKKVILTLLILVFNFALAWAGDEPATIESNRTAIDLVQTNADYVWTLVAAALVFFMQAGFALSLIHISEPTRPNAPSRIPSSA